MTPVETSNETDLVSPVTVSVSRTWEAFGAVDAFMADTATAGAAETDTVVAGRWWLSRVSTRFALWTVTPLGTVKLRYEVRAFRGIAVA